MSSGIVRLMRMPMSSATPTAHSRPKRAPLFARSNFPAPRFCPIKVVRAITKLEIGRKAKPSTLVYAPQPATAMVPKALMLDCTSTLARAIAEFWNPEGRP